MYPGGLWAWYALGTYPGPYLRRSFFRSRSTWSVTGGCVAGEVGGGRFAGEVAGGCCAVAGGAGFSSSPQPGERSAAATNTAVARGMAMPVRLGHDQRLRGRL